MCRADVADAPESNTAPDVWRLRRLTRDELARTFDVLVGSVPPSLTQLPQEDANLGASAPAPSSFEVDLYREIANEAAEAGAKKLLSRWRCGDVNCVRAVLPAWIERAQRGPLARRERDAYLSVFAGGANPTLALRETLQLVFQSPRFLYVIERGVSHDSAEVTRALTPWELAARLSYFLWSEPPDDGLRAAAESGRLADSRELSAQARRLIKDPKAARSVGRALQKWAAPDLEIVAKSHTVYPEFVPEVRASMVEQFTRFAAMAIADDESLVDVLTTQRAPVNGELAALLGLDDRGASGWRVEELPAPRFGLLTLPGVLTSNARADDSSPVQRGLFIRRNLLCQEIAPPPAGIPALPPASSAGLSFRERFDIHTSNAACAVCHKLMDPLGFPFEIYDGLGRLRGDLSKVRTEGKLDGVAEPAAFSDLQGLVDALRNTPEVSTCWAEQWMQRALGPEGAADIALRDQLALKVAAGASLTELIVDIVTSTAFTRVPRPHTP